MAPEIVDVLRRGARTTVYALALGVVFLLISGFVAQDLWRSVREVQALRSGALCGQAPPPCTTAIAVTLDGPFYERRDALETWRTVDERSRRRPPAAVRRRPREPAARLRNGVRRGRQGRRRRRRRTTCPDCLGRLARRLRRQRRPADDAGTGRHGAPRRAVSAQVRRPLVRSRRAPRTRPPAPKTPPEMVLAAIGSLALLSTIRFGLDVGASVVTTLVIVVAAFMVPRLWRRWRRATTKGRHAAY